MDLIKKNLARIGPAAYKLALREGSLIHPVFHVSQQKPFIPDHTPVFSELPKPLTLDAEQIQPEAILDRKLVKKGTGAHLQVLVKWTSWPESLSTWEDYHVLQKHFPAAPA